MERMLVRVIRPIKIDMIPCIRKGMYFLRQIRARIHLALLCPHAWTAWYALQNTVNPRGLRLRLRIPLPKAIATT